MVTRIQDEITRLKTKLLKLVALAMHEGVVQTFRLLISQKLRAAGQDDKTGFLKDAFTDRKFSISTGGIFLPDDLDARIIDHAVHYEPTPEYEFTHFISKIPVDFAAYCFVDYGSGKGRVICLAGAYPFRKILGIEASKSLHLIACANIRNSSTIQVNRQRVQSIHMNAANYTPTSSPLVVYFYNPFDEVILSQCIENIHTSASDCCKPSYIIYKNPLHHETIVASGHFFPMTSCLDAIIYKSTPLKPT